MTWYAADDDDAPDDPRGLAQELAGVRRGPARRGGDPRRAPRAHAGDVPPRAVEPMGRRRRRVAAARRMGPADGQPPDERRPRRARRRARARTGSARRSPSRSSRRRRCADVRRASPPSSWPRRARASRRPSSLTALERDARGAWAPRARRAGRDRLSRGEPLDAWADAADVRDARRSAPASSGARCELFRAELVGGRLVHADDAAARAASAPGPPVRRARARADGTSPSRERGRDRRAARRRVRAAWGSTRAGGQAVAAGDFLGAPPAACGPTASQGRNVARATVAVRHCSGRDVPRLAPIVDVPRPSESDLGGQIQYAVDYARARADRLSRDPGRCSGAAADRVAHSPSSSRVACRDGYPLAEQPAVLRRPAPEITRQEWLAQLGGSLFDHGNAALWLPALGRDAAGLAELAPVLPWGDVARAMGRRLAG